MTNKGSKYLTEEVAKARTENIKLKGMNARLHNEIRAIQSVQFSMLEPSFFKARRQWIRLWRKYRKA